jgi:hypothetical protein
MRDSMVPERTMIMGSHEVDAFSLCIAHESMIHWTSAEPPGYGRPARRRNPLVRLFPVHHGGCFACDGKYKRATLRRPSGLRLQIAYSTVSERLR